jgi:hypothetical protein
LTSDGHFAIVIGDMVARSALGRSALWLAIYSLCLVFVCSFILFEVLDVDGSDFPSSATQAVAAEAPHADVRRLHFEPALGPEVPPVLPSMREPDCAPVVVVIVAGPQPAPVSPGSDRRLLPRASLGDVPPSA